MQVLVRDNNVDQALRALKKKMQREGIFREMKLRRNYEKPSEKRAREKAEAVRRTRKLLRKRRDDMNARNVRIRRIGRRPERWRDLERLCETTTRAHGPIDMFFANAGVPGTRELGGSDDEWLAGLP